MFELASLSLTDLRTIARHLAVPEAATRQKTDLLTELGRRLPEVESVWSSALSGSGRISLRSSSAASAAEVRATHTGEPETDVSRGVEHLGTLTSGAGREAEAELKPPPFVIPDLPWVYEDDRVVLLIRDPRTLFTYWDFNPETVRLAREAVPGGTPHLRLVMLGGSEPRVIRELNVELEWRAYYLYDCEPNRDYRVELVLRGPSGERLIGRPSNQATLPNNRPSTWVEDRFASIPLEIPLPTASLFAVGRVSVETERRLHARSYELSGGELAIDHTGDVASSSQSIAKGFGGRAWSGTMVKK